MDIPWNKKINIIGVGSISTLLILLMIETVFAQILVDTILDNVSNNLMLLIIMMGMFVFTIVIAIVVGYFITADISTNAVYRSTALSLGCLILFLFILANGSLFIYYREVYVNIHGFEIVPVFPQVLIKFSIYILGDVFSLFILIFISYYVFFVFFLEKLYERKEIKVE